MRQTIMKHHHRQRIAQYHFTFIRHSRVVVQYGFYIRINKSLQFRLLLLFANVVFRQNHYKALFPNDNTPEKRCYACSALVV